MKSKVLFLEEMENTRYLQCPVWAALAAIYDLNKTAVTQGFRTEILQYETRL
jgi:hypothetical protein